MGGTYAQDIHRRRDGRTRNWRGRVCATNDPPGGQMAPPAAKRTILQKFDVPAGDRETVVVLIESAPNTDFARHTHPGPETGYIVEGEITQNALRSPTRAHQCAVSSLIRTSVSSGVWATK